MKRVGSTLYVPVCSRIENVGPCQAPVERSTGIGPTRLLVGHGKKLALSSYLFDLDSTSEVFSIVEWRSASLAI